MSRLSIGPAAAMAAVLILLGCSSTPRTQPSPQPAEAKLPPPVGPVVVPPTPVPPLRPSTFAAIPGWDKDNLREALPAFIASCTVLQKKPEWGEVCFVAGKVNPSDEKAARLFFESFFTPYQVINADGSTNGLVTGYYEPLLKGARKRGGPYQTPLYAPPADMLSIDIGDLYPELKTLRLRGRLSSSNKVVPYFSRAELEQAPSLPGKELLWVDDPVDAFFLQVQGSGRVQLNDTKETVRVAYADQNGHPYRSIGRYLVDRQEMTLDQASAQNIKTWIAAHPSRRQEVLNANPSYVFFKEEKILDPRKGPKGALGVPLTPARSIAVDPQTVPLGVPVFISTTQPGEAGSPLNKLTLAQDTGGAIKGRVRADFFWGFGAESGEQAGKMKQSGLMWVLLPK